MAIRIIGDPPLVVEEGSIAFQLINIFKSSPTSLEMFLEIFNQFPHKNKYSQSKLVDLISELRSIYIAVTNDVVQEIQYCISLVYQGSETEISDFRGLLVELVVVHLGPFHESLLQKYELVSNGKFYLDEARVGDSQGHSDSNLDSVFHSQAEFREITDVCCESYECKASVRTYLHVIKGMKPPKIIEHRHYKKLQYLRYLQRYFYSSKNFTIAFATFQLNTRIDLETLKKMDMTSLSIIGGKDLSAAWVKKFSS